MSVDLEWIGKSSIRKDAVSKVTGTGQYAADIALDRKTYGVAVRSTQHHAYLLGVDTRVARSALGVIAVLTTADIPGEKIFGALVIDQPVLAEKEVRHVGEPIAVVVADTYAHALAASRQVQVMYEPLQAVHDPEEALREGSPLVHPGGNLLSHYEVSCGNMEQGFQAADVVFEDQFSVQRISPAYMETENSLACCNPDGSIRVWVSSQKPFEDQKTIAAVLALPLEKVQVCSALVGGAFGGKEDSSISVLTALAAWYTHRTVQMKNTRHESFTAHPKRHPAKFQIKMGAKADGTLTAVDIHAVMDTGAYASYGPAVGSLLTEMAPGSYRCDNIHVSTEVVYTHNPYAGAMRGFGSPQAHFALESCLDELAEKLNLDPLAIRRKNILHPGDRLVTQVAVDECAVSLPICLDQVEAARQRMKAAPVTPGMRSGVGFALAIQSMGLGAKVLDESAQRLEWLPDGKVLIHLGAPELGQGLTTVAEQMVAEALEIPFDQVVTLPLDTLHSPNGGVTCGSRMTYLVGNALLTAAEMLKAGLLAQAARMLSAPINSLQYKRGQIITGDGQCYPVSEFSSRCADAGEPLLAEAKAEFAYPSEKTPQHLPIGMPHIKFAFAAQVARVEVDPELGTVRVKEVEAIHDPGKVINRGQVEGQIEGGIAMGVGYALLEEMPLKSDYHWVDSFTEYLLPTAMDVPEKIQLHLFEIPEASGPYGAKGIAEISLVPTAPAIANAVYDAVGVRIRDLPITPEKIILP